MSSRIPLLILAATSACASPTAGGAAPPGGGEPQLLTPEEAKQYPTPAEYEYPEVPPGEIEMGRAINPTSPSASALAATKAALSRRGPLTGRVHFCVDRSGAVGYATTVKSTLDAEVDGIFRETVKGWRFQPPRHKGQPIPVCSVVDFNVKFQ